MNSQYMLQLEEIEAGIIYITANTDEEIQSIE